MSEAILIEDRFRRFQPRLAASLLLWLIIGFVVIFIVWAALTELDRTVRGQGRVVPSSRLQIISNLEGGMVDAILVRGGADVVAGQPLLRLDPTQMRSELTGNRSAATALSARIARLEAEVAGRSPAYPAEAGDAAATERAVHRARSAELQSLLAGGAARIAQAERGVAEARSALVARQSARDAAASERDLIRPLVERGIEPQLSSIQAENRARVTASDAATASEAVARASAALREARAASEQARQDWRARAATELAAARAEYAGKRSTTPALTSRVDRTVVRAPVSGRINRVLVTTIGGSVAPGQPLVELVPAREQLQVEAAINPRDIASVRIDQPARLDITAYEAAVYGSLKGRVVAISPDAVVDERTGESHYIVRIATDSAGLRGKDGRPLPIGAGMVATVNLLGDKRSVLSYILTPITRLSETALRE